MKLIICVDENNGMLFNQRRQSRDKELIKHIKNLVWGKKLWISSFSEKLFDGVCEYHLFDNENSTNIGEDDFCFVENFSPKMLESEIDELIVYNWNRSYPADTYFDICLDNWKLISEQDIRGSSHEKITERIYQKGAD